LDQAFEEESQGLQRALQQVRTALSGLRYGQVLVTVHDGAVVQIERTEKVRLERPVRLSGKSAEAGKPLLGVPVETNRSTNR
jgi:hypothetical protein